MKPIFINQWYFLQDCICGDLQNGEYISVSVTHRSKSNEYVAVIRSGIVHQIYHIPKGKADREKILQSRHQGEFNKLEIDNDLPN